MLAICASLKVAKISGMANGVGGAAMLGLLGVEVRSYTISIQSKIDQSLIQLPIKVMLYLRIAEQPLDSPWTAPGQHKQQTPTFDIDSVGAPCMTHDVHRS